MPRSVLAGEPFPGFSVLAWGRPSQCLIPYNPPSSNRHPNMDKYAILSLLSVLRRKSVFLGERVFSLSGSLKRNRLTAYLLSLVLLPIMLFAVFAYFKVVGIYLNQFENQSMALIETTATSLNDQLVSEMNLLQTMAQSPAVTSLDPNLAEPYFRRFLETDSRYSHFLITDGEGIELAHSEGEAYHGVSIAHRDYFYVPWEEEKAYVADANFSVSTGRKILAIGTPIYNEAGIKIGVLCGFMHLGYLSDKISGLGQTENGYSFIVNSEGYYLVHPNEAYILEYSPLEDPSVSESFRSVVENMMAGYSGVAEAPIGEQDMVLVSAPLDRHGWSMALASPRDEVYRDVYALVWVGLALFGTIVLIVLGLAWYINRGIIQPVRRLGELGDLAAAGDLTVDLQQSSRNEIGVLEKSFGSLITSLRGIVQQVQKASVKVVESVHDLTARAQQTSAGANEVAATVTRLAEVTSELEERAQEAAADADETARLAGEGKSQVDAVVNQMKAISKSSEEVLQVITRLSENAGSISQITGLINDIADQTNLLALNAAIEAARAGDSGRGFAVVAEEVRKLAEQSAAAADEIKSLVATIQGGAEEAVSAMQAGSEDVRYGTRIVNEVGGSFAQIVALVQRLARRIQDLARATEQMAGDVSNVAAIAEEQTAAMQETSSMAEVLNSLAGELEAATRRFRA